MTRTDVGLPHPSTPVICCMRSAELTDVVVRAVVEAGGIPRPGFWSDLSRLDGTLCSGLIYDLTPYDRRALDLITAIRQQCPWLPIMLYVAPTETALAAIPFVQGLDNVRVLVQSAVRTDHFEFTREVRRFVNELPLNRAVSMIEEVIPDKTPALRSYLRGALRSLERGERVRVDCAAAGLGVTARTFQRRLKLQHLPNPKEMLDWATLIYAAFLSDLAHMPVSRIARRFGLTSHDLYRLRSRLTPKAGIRLSARSQLDTVVRAFAERCGPIERRIDEVSRPPHNFDTGSEERIPLTIEKPVFTDEIPIPAPVATLRRKTSAV